MALGGAVQVPLASIVCVTVLEPPVEDVSSADIVIDSSTPNNPSSSTLAPALYETPALKMCPQLCVDSLASEFLGS